MTSISEIMTTFTPVLEEASSRAKKGQATQLDQRICDLATKIHSVRDAHGSCSFDNFKVVNDHLSLILNLADLKTFLKCSPETANRIVTYLNLKQNFDKINQRFQVLERIQTVSERILEHVSLFNLQLTGFVIDVDHSPVWYALVSEEQFLNRQVRDLKEFKIGTHVASARIQDIEEEKAHLLQELRNESFTPPGYFGSLNLSIGKLRGRSPDK